MGIILYLILLFIWGLILGGLARLALPGPDPMSIPMTAAIGVGGSWIGGLVMWAITGDPNAAGLLVSFAFAVLLVYLVRRRRGQSLWSTRRPPSQTRF
jgi:uncharacterized membrane protein YeaQ/YmgE (transglycosylase-associated protein family)